MGLMKDTYKNAVKSIKGLSDAQLDYKAAAEKWSVRNCIYHIAATEKGLWGMFEGAMKSPANPEKRSEIKDELFVEAKEKFSEIKDALSKEKIIKSTLELEIVTDNKEFLALDEVESSDWFLVSKLSKITSSKELLGSFKLEDIEFKVYKASGHKCPRCWKYTSTKEETLCSRCEEVVK